MKLRSLGTPYETPFGTFWIHSSKPIGASALQHWLENHLDMQDDDEIVWADYSYIVLESMVLDFELKEGEHAFRTYFENRNGSRSHNFKLYQMVFSSLSDEFVAIQEMHGATRLATPDAPKDDEDKSKKKDVSTS